MSATNIFMILIVTAIVIVLTLVVPPNKEPVNIEFPKDSFIMCSKPFNVNGSWYCDIDDIIYTDKEITKEVSNG